MTEAAKHYNPKEIERKIYEKWLPFFKVEKQKGKKTFIALIAPPNITGVLHLGHALENTMIDIMARYRRFKGDRVIWLPGTDHASISTQNVVEKKLKKHGLTRFDLGRKKFLEEVWRWRDQFGDLILEQFKRIGISPDWSRIRFTLDKEYVKTVEDAFIHYCKKGLIYRDDRAINFCPRCRTSLSDLEIDWRENNGNLFYIRYKIKAGSNEDLIVATTRPETILADVALAVSPTDKRYQKYLGEKAILPLVNREILIIADKRVDPNFGTGVLKITPAHSLIDYEIAQRHSLPMISVIDQEAKICNSLPEFNGLDWLEAREKIIERLKAIQSLEKIEAYQHSLPYCERCGAALQVIPSKEWFLKMKDLAELAKAAVKQKKVRISPDRFKKVYFDWLKNVRDWCVSRKIWWGQQLPVWFCQNCLKNKSDVYKISRLKPQSNCNVCKKQNWSRTEEVFDTWFSSALWPFAILYSKKEQAWYPADIVSSARDIFHLWITRMIFSGLYFKGKEPFKKVFIHPTIMNKAGQRMSKSLGTGIDPIELVEKYGADVLRFGLIWQTQQTQDIRFNEDYFETGSKFANKVWNAVRFYQIFKDKNKESRADNGNLTKADQLILKDLKKTINLVEKKILNFEFSPALQSIYRFFWNRFCDVYLESSKTGKNNDKVLELVIFDSLKLLHPFMPFLTEQLWLNLGQKKLLFLQSWPETKTIDQFLKK